MPAPSSGFAQLRRLGYFPESQRIRQWFVVARTPALEGLGRVRGWRLTRERAAGDPAGDEPGGATVSSDVPATMRAAVYRERARIEVESRPIPTLGPGDALLRVSHCGVCGTDLHLVMEGWGASNSIGGHEYSGRIVRLGSRVAGWRVGDAVVGGAEPGCGACEYCRSQRPALCSAHADAGDLGDFQGAFAEYMRVDARQLVRVPDGVGLREAAIAEPLAVALHGITRSGVRPGQRAVVTGAGPIGMFTLAALLAKGVEDVTVSEPSPARRALARKVGASRVVAPDALEVPKLPSAIVEGAVDAAFECSGNGMALRQALSQLKKAGTLVILGTGMEKPRIDPIRVLLCELVLTGAYEYDEDGFADALELLVSGRLPTDLLIESEDATLEGLQGAMEGLAAGSIGGKVLVVPRAEEE